jgi:hypothetical protein
MDQARGDQGSTAYLVDSLFRPAGNPAATTAGQPTNAGQTTNAAQPTNSGQTTQPATPASATARATSPIGQGDRQEQRAEVGRVLQVALDGELSQEDKSYVSQVIAENTGMTRPEAEQRLNQTIERAKAAKAEAKQRVKEAADAARQVGMYTALWGAVAMLAGAFCAALAAAWGGRARDL